MNDFEDFGDTQQNINDFTDAHQPNGHPFLSVLLGAAEGAALGLFIAWLWRSAFGKILLFGVLAVVAFIWFTY